MILVSASPLTAGLAAAEALAAGLAEADAAAGLVDAAAAEATGLAEAAALSAGLLAGGLEGAAAPPPQAASKMMHATPMAAWTRGWVRRVPVTESPVCVVLLANF